MSNKSLSRQSLINHYENQEKLAIQKQEQWIKAGNTLRAMQSRAMAERFRNKSIVSQELIDLEID